MTKSPALSLFALPLLGLLLTAACTAQNDAAPAATTPAAATPAATTQASPPAAEAATVDAASSAASTAQTGRALVPGTDYVQIPGGQPFEPLNGKIEVVEVFSYTCSHCADFQQLVNAWKPQLPADVRYTYVPAPLRGAWEAYAKAFYAAEATGVLAQSHDATFRAIHIDRSLPIQPLPTEQQLAAFYAQYGADPQQFTSALSSFAVGSKLKRAQQFIERSFVGVVPSTPALIINGKYRVTARTLEDDVRITNQLIAQERAAREGAAQQ